MSGVIEVDRLERAVPVRDGGLDSEAGPRARAPERDRPGARRRWRRRARRATAWDRFIVGNVGIRREPQARRGTRELLLLQAAALGAEDEGRRRGARLGQKPRKLGELEGAREAAPAQRGRHDHDRKLGDGLVDPGDVGRSRRATRRPRMPGAGSRGRARPRVRRSRGGAGRSFSRRERPSRGWRSSAGGRGRRTEPVSAKEDSLDESGGRFGKERGPSGLIICW